MTWPMPCAVAGRKRNLDPRDELLRAALSFPGAYEDAPWGEQVVKVNQKIFAFLGTASTEPHGATLKLPASSELATSLPGVEGAGYGLARAGWVHIGDLDAAGAPDLELLLDWLDESYRAVAPKRLIAELDGRA